MKIWLRFISLVYIAPMRADFCLDFKGFCQHFEFEDNWVYVMNLFKIYNDSSCFISGPGWLGSWNGISSPQAWRALHELGTLPCKSEIAPFWFKLYRIFLENILVRDPIGVDSCCDLLCNVSFRRPAPACVQVIHLWKMDIGVLCWPPHLVNWIWCINVDPDRVCATPFLISFETKHPLWDYPSFLLAWSASQGEWRLRCASLG